MNAIETSGLGKEYAPGVGLRPMTLEVAPGEIFGFLGPNGAGKTTAIRTLLGFLRPTAGSARILGHDVWRGREAVHARVGYLPGEIKLRPEWTAGEVIRRAAALRGQHDLAHSLTVARRLALDVTRRVGTLSKGNRQKVGLCAALAARADVLILDEPTDGLDPLAQDTVLALLREARSEGRTVFLSSHVLTEVERVADRVGLIRAGDLVRVDDLAALTAGLPQRVSVHFAASPTRDFTALPGLTDVVREGHELHANWRGAPGDLLRALADEELSAFSVTPPTLEDAFLGEYRGTGHDR
ncbi:ABC-2 type transport system ATP-binding protein [Deinococcus metalli]|uniref:ABC-2 type transport system ATP-binding protein n=1 Tax=Deinococcus metalli TaxID=1141878 RepID=A0A7W8KBW4_9DEIO|nr:ABC transporter ATP-binding protein [Deinococcus metalli]MBB5375105.1 ABC-2 type transport system ATP-binding protein [Deinococcus metalli]